MTIFISLFTLLIPLFGGGVIYLGVKWLSHRKEIFNSYTKVSGTITGEEKRTSTMSGPSSSQGRVSVNYAPIIEYKYEEVTYKHIPKIATGVRVNVGETVGVLVNPNNPEDAAFASPTFLYSPKRIIFIGSCIVVIGLGLSFHQIIFPLLK
jgi:hypothetical protein